MKVYLRKKKWHATLNTHSESCLQWRGTSASVSPVSITCLFLVAKVVSMVTPLDNITAYIDNFDMT